MADAHPGPEGQTRDRILGLLMQHGTLCALDIATQLGLSAAGIRRHVDNLVRDNLIEEAPATGTTRRGRGRPARVFRLTDQGRSKFGFQYDTLAVEALRALRDAGGEEAVTLFAQRRMQDMVAEAGVDLSSVEPDQLAEAAEKLAAVLTKHGYAATVHAAGNGVQICRHHCPIQGVAEQFPEMCEAEHNAVRSALGWHTQPLATIADGNGVCTTHIPLTPVARTRAAPEPDTSGRTEPTATHPTERPEATPRPPVGAAHTGPTEPTALTPDTPDDPTTPQPEESA